MQKITHVLTLIVLCWVVNNVHAQNTYTLDSTVLTSRTVIDSIDIPWEITWGHDDYIWMTERFGRVSRVNPQTGDQQVILDISATVYDNSESGLLGLALHPDFATNPYVYIVYTYLSGSNILERLVRYTYNGSSLVSPLTLLDNITGNTTHIGSRLLILPDKTLLMSTGDAQSQSLPQNKNALEGKILRMNLDGTVPADNPTPNSLVYAVGLRNTQGICRAPNGVVYLSEHGPTSDDELNLLIQDRNYGWPTVTGYCNTPPEINFCNANNVLEPIAAWTPTIAPSDLVWYNHSAIPEFNNKLLMTVLKDKELIAFGFNAAGDSVVAEKAYLQNAFGRLRDICISPSGKIYLATNGASWNNTKPFTHSIVELSNNAATAVKKHQAIVHQINIGPNPISVGQTLLVELPVGVTGHLTLSNVWGQPVLKQTLHQQANFPISLLEGVYMWKVDFEDGSFRQGKLVVR